MFYVTDELEGTFLYTGMIKLLYYIARQFQVSVCSQWVLCMYTDKQPGNVKDIHESGCQQLYNDLTNNSYQNNIFKNNCRFSVVVSFSFDDKI